MKFIGKRISYQTSEEALTVVIAATVEKYKLALLMLWLVCWTVCGTYFLYQLTGDYSRELKMYMVILLSFWAYYEFKVAQIFLWRKFGYEYLRLTDNKLILKNVIRGMGKSRTFLVGNIERFSTTQRDPKAFLEVMQNSFWVKGNDTVFFDYQGKRYGFGKQLSPDEAHKLVVMLNREKRNYR